MLLLAPSKLVIFVLNAISGFAYVAGVTEERRHMCADRHEHGGSRNVAKFLLCLPLAYMSAPHFTLRVRCC